MPIILDLLLLFAILGDFIESFFSFLTFSSASRYIHTYNNFLKMREFGILGAESAIEDSFSNITALASGCRYRDCSHTNEPGCAVREAVNSGAISQEHYDHYLKLRAESEFYQMSYIEKRKKDRDFGRSIKSAKKDFEDE